MVNENLIIMKFGGSCLQDANSFEHTTKIIRKYKEQGKLVIVTSAMCPPMPALRTVVTDRDHLVLSRITHNPGYIM